MRSTNTLTRADICEAVHKKTGYPKSESQQLVEDVLDLMTEALISGENVKISGFGTFLLRDKAERVGRNPKTGVEVPITPRRVLIFRASQALRDKVSKA
ncbi:integration host factor subunit alpha [Blastomonas marina]|jgi:integration host factor subunit alpha|uniref:Integration host factor subunit alpha n=1 Tax=Blastomonas marina TaxID=1867408 RepID=A0ABQ1FBW9_9SPHN|nr:integration host factor subunit alpha [Blastomonas marina]GGA06326.1 integration host factor subunit alpha [Blastomonas marina]